MANHLEHLAEFQEILADYDISPDEPVLERSDLVLLVGATATGRDTVIHELVKTGRYRHLVSNTTRQPRVNNGVPEQNGVEYWFVSEKQMLDDLRSGRMLEAEIIHDQQVSGISLAELQRCVDEHKVAITNVDLMIGNIVKAKPDAVPIMMLPPSFSEAMRRLQSRGELGPDEIRRRLITAKKIYRAGLDWGIFHFVVNDTVEHAVEQVEKAVKREEDPDQQAKHRELVEQLLQDTSDWLAR